MKLNPNNGVPDIVDGVNIVLLPELPMNVKVNVVPFGYLSINISFCNTPLALSKYNPKFKQLAAISAAVG